MTRMKSKEVPKISKNARQEWLAYALSETSNGCKFSPFGRVCHAVVSILRELTA